MPMNRRDMEQIKQWFASGLRNTLEANPHAVKPSDQDVQGPTGPHPYTDMAYEAGVAIGRQILADQEKESSC